MAVNNQGRRVILLEQALRERLLGGVRSHVDALADRDPATLSDAEAVEAWRAIAHRQRQKPAPHPPGEEAEIVAEWGRIRCRS